MLLQHHVTSLGSKYSITQRNNLLDQQRKLEARITSYEHQMAVIMKLDDDIQWSRHNGKIPNVDLEPGDMPDNIWSCILMDGLHRKGNKSLSHLH